MTTRMMLNMLKGVGALLGVGGLAYGVKKGSEWKTGSAIQTGVISNIDDGGLIWKTYDIKVQRSRISNGDGNKETLMSLHGNQELIEKAKKYCETGTFVKIYYDQTLFPNVTKAASNLQVTNIEEVPVDGKSITI